MPLCLIWLAIGAFALGTESYVIAGLIPALARDLHVSLAAAGQLVSVFAITYAVGAPVAAAVFGSVPRRRLLIASLSAFAVANGVAATAQSFAVLVAARALLALAAAAFLPASNAVAAVIVGPERRARAMAVITGGGTLAVAMGAPLGTWIAGQGNWRATFVFVGCFAALAVVGLMFGLPRTLPLATVSLRERVGALRIPNMIPTLAVSVLWAAGGFTFYTYIAPFMSDAAKLEPKRIGFLLMAIGISAALGTALGGMATDRIGTRPVQYACAAALIAFLAALSLVAHNLAAAVVCAGLWATAGWAFGAPQQLRLIALNADLAPVTLSLHASAVYIGIALGSVLGGLTIEFGSVAAIGFAGAACQLLALLTLLAIDFGVRLERAAIMWFRDPVS